MKGIVKYLDNLGLTTQNTSSASSFFGLGNSRISSFQFIYRFLLLGSLRRPLFWGTSMFKHIATVIGLFIALCLSTDVLAVEFDENKYEVYYGDFNSDGKTGDVYFHALPVWLLLRHGDGIHIPLDINKDKGFVYYSGEGSDAHPFNIEQSQLATYQKAVLGINYFFEDVNLDGEVDVRVLAQSGSSSGVNIYGGGNNLPQEIEEVTGLLARGVVTSPTTPVLADSNLVSAEDIAATDQVGATTGAFDVNASGAAIYAVPIMAAVGTAGVTPQLSLSYNSASPNGIAGSGWHLGSQKALSRCGQSRLYDGSGKEVNWSASDRFCLSGQRLLLISGTYGAPGSEYKTAIDTQVIVTAHGGTTGNPDFFTVKGKDGSLTTFGGAGLHQSEQNARDASGIRIAEKILTWAISEFQDNVGNPIKYFYNNSSDLFSLDEVRFAYGSGNTHNSHIKINYGSTQREDIIRGYSAGYEFVTAYKVASIESYNEGQLLRRYNLNYNENGADYETDNLSRLTSIQECVTQSNCLPKTTFEWREPQLSFDATRMVSSALSQPYVLPNSDTSYQIGQTIFVDINGDGRQDRISVRVKQTIHDPGRYFQSVDYDQVILSSTSNGLTEEMPVEGERAVSGGRFFDEEYRPVRLIPIDINADGRTDLLASDAESDSSEGKWKLFVSRFQDTGEWSLEYARDYVFDEDTSFGDINGDGLVDAVSFNKDINSVNVWYLKKDLTQDDGSHLRYSFAEEAVSIPIHLEVGQFNLSLSYKTPVVADFNQDGKVDLAIQRYQKGFYCENNQCSYMEPSLKRLTHLQVYVQSENGFEYFDTLYDLPEGVSETDSDFDFLHYVTEEKDIRPVDLNADGLIDIAYHSQIRFFNHVDGMEPIQGNYQTTDDRGWRFHLNTGNGFTSAKKITEIGEWAANFSDFNQDGFPDLIYQNEDEGKIQYIPWDNTENRFDSTDRLVLNRPYKEDIYINFSDLNGDGALEIVELDYEDYLVNIFHSYSNVNARGDLIYSVEDGLGNKTEINYESLIFSDHYTSIEQTVEVSESEEESCWQWTDGVRGGVNCRSKNVFSLDESDFYTKINRPFSYLPEGTEPIGVFQDAPVFEAAGAIPVVTAVTSRSPSTADSNNTNTIEYSYHQLRIQPGGVGPLGFSGISKLDVQKNIQTFTRFRQDWPYIGQRLSNEAVSAEGNFLNTDSVLSGIYNYTNLLSSYCSDTNASGDCTAGNFSSLFDLGVKTLGPIQVYTKESISTSYDLVDNGASQGDALASKKTESHIDAYGNITQTIEKTKAGDNLNNTIDTHYFVKTTTTSEYGTSEQDKQWGRLSSTVATIEKPSISPSTNTKATRFSYYDMGGNCASSDSGHSGNLTGLLCEETLVVNSVNIITTRNYYDEFGNKTFKATTDNSSGQNRLSAFVEYDAQGRYLEKTYDIFDGAETVGVSVNDEVYNSTASALGATIRLVSDVRTRGKYGESREMRHYLGSGYKTAITEVTPFGNPYFVASSDGSYTLTRSSKNNLSYCPAGTNFKTRTTSSGGGESETCFDLLGRKLRSRSKGFDGNWVQQDTEYDGLGRVTRVSEPYKAGDVIYWTVTAEEGYNIRDQVSSVTLPFYEVDTLGNATSTLATSQVVRNGFTTTQINTQGQQKITTANVIGEIVSVQDNLLNTVSYTYDINGNLKTVTDPQLNTIHMSYDALGKKIYMDDPDKGIWRYQYNHFGELLCQIDAKGNIVQNVYDFKGRVIERIDREPANNSSCDTPTGNIVGHTYWQFDVATNGLGAISDEQDTVSGYSVEYTYDNLGRASKKSTYIPGTPSGNNFHYQKTTYDHLGRVFQVFDAARNDDNYNTNGIQNIYNANGYLSKVVDAEYIAGESRQEYYEVTSMDARGNITENKLGGDTTGTITRAIYNPRSGLIERLQTQSWQVLQDMNMRWDHATNLIYREDLGLKDNGQQRNLKESFAYDALNRLTDYSVSGDVSHSTSVSYDNIGNITSKSDVGSYSYSEYGPHAVSNAGNIAYHYDANGNLTSDGRDRVFTYSTFDKVTRVQNEGRITQFYYGTNRNRYKRIDVDTEGKQTKTLYVGSVEKVYYHDGIVHWKRNIGGIAQITHKFNANGSEADADLLFLHKDHLGSINLITDVQGNSVQQMAFDPWGERRTTESWQTLLPLAKAQDFFVENKPLTTRGFTGHEMVDEMEIIHMNGRIYDAKLARFLQADPFIQAPTEIGSLNRYSYVMNNPLNATDPSGYFFTGLGGFIDLFVNYELALIINDAVTYISQPWFRALAKNETTYTVVSTAVTVVVAIFCAPCAIGVSAYFAQQMTYYQTGDKWKALHAGGKAAVVATVTWGIGQAVKMPAKINYDTTAAYNTAMREFVVMKTTLHGLVGGINAELNGGEFLQGFAASAVTAAANSQMSGKLNPTNLVISGLAGGTASVITGGKFANGAVSGMMVYMLNQVSPKNREQESAQAFRSSLNDEQVELLDTVFNGGTSGFSPSKSLNAYWDLMNSLSSDQASLFAGAFGVDLSSSYPTKLARASAQQISNDFIRKPLDRLNMTAVWKMGKATFKSIYLTRAPSLLNTMKALQGSESHVYLYKEYQSAETFQNTRSLFGYD